MKWPLKRKAVSGDKIPFFNLQYLCAAGAGSPDSTIVWTSEIPWQQSQDYVKEYTSQHSRFISTSHILVQAVGQALAVHPQLNRRVVGRRIHEFKDCNVSLATRVPNSNEVFVIQTHNADQRPLYQIAYIITTKQMEYARTNSRERRDIDRFRKMPGFLTRAAIRVGDWLDRNFVVPVTGRIDRLRESGVLVNDFSSSRFPVMRGYKPSRQPGESKPLSVTLGRPEEKVIWENGKANVTHVAPITVRIDHRIADGFHLAQFLNTIISKMSNPASMEPVSTGESQAELPHQSAKQTSPALPTRMSA